MTLNPKITFAAAALILMTVVGIVSTKTSIPSFNAPPAPSLDNQDKEKDFPMFIENLRERDYPASKVIIEETLPSGSNYQRHIAFYESDDLKIYGLLTISSIPRPVSGFPTIVFLHGYVNPKQYSPTKDYVTRKISPDPSSFTGALPTPKYLSNFPFI